MLVVKAEDSKADVQARIGKTRTELAVASIAVIF